jgi:hypothetical protein
LKVQLHQRYSGTRHWSSGLLKRDQPRLDTI